MTDRFTHEQLSNMIRDANNVRQSDKTGWMLPDDVYCHVQALVAEVEKCYATIEAGDTAISQLEQGVEAMEREQCECGFRDVVCAECGEPR